MTFSVEWEQPDTSQASRVLHEGRHLAAVSFGQADVPDQLHGDGPCDGSTPHLPPLKGAADQGRLTAAQKGVWM